MRDDEQNHDGRRAHQLRVLRRVPEGDGSRPEGRVRVGTSTPSELEAGKPITYFLALAEEFDGWAESCCLRPESLRKLGETALRTRRENAFVEHESHRAHGDTPDVYTLVLGEMSMYFSDEPHAFVIRGYRWPIEGEPLDDLDGGGFYCGNDAVKTEPENAPSSEGGDGA